MAGSIVGEAWVAVGAQTDQVDDQVVDAFTKAGKKGADAFDDSLDKATKSSTSQGKSSGAGLGKSFLAGFAGAMAAPIIANTLKGFVTASEDAAKVSAQTEAVIKSTGGAANVSAKQVDDLANAISKKTAVDDEAIKTGANLLLTFTNVKNEVGEGRDVFNRATQTITDMAAAMGTDAKGSAIQLGKALNDPIKGVSALGEVGVTFTDQQKKMIETMVKAGDTAGAQGVILDELAKEFGGSAEAQATASAKMKVAWGELQEQIGTQLMPIIAGAFGGLTKLIDGFASLPGPLQSVTLGLGVAAGGLYGVSKIMNIVGGATDTLRPALETLINRLTVLGDTGTRSMSRLGKAVAIVGLVTATAAFTLFAKSVHDAGNSIAIDVDKLAGAAEDDLDRVAVGLTQFFDKVGELGGAEREKAMGTFLKEFRATADQNIDAAIRLRDAIGDTGASTDEYTKIIEESIAATQRRGLSEERAAEKIKETGFIAEVTKEQIDEYTAFMEKNSEQVEQSGEAHRLWTESLVDADEAMGNLIDRLFDVTNADADWNEAVEKTIKTLHENGNNLDVWNARGRENRDVLQEMITKGGEWLGTIFEQEGASQNFKTTSQRIRDSLIETMKQAGLTQEQIDTYIKVWDQVPSEIETTVKVTAVGDWEKLLALPGLHGGPSLGSMLNAAGVSFGAEGGNFVIPHYAGGTHSAPRGLAVVGELGPELVQFGGSAAVFPADQFERQMARALSSVLGGRMGATTVNVMIDNVSYGDAHQVATMVGQGVQRVLESNAIGVGVRQGAGR